MTGKVDQITGTDGTQFTVSTISRMGIWETAVIEGRPGFFSRRNHRFVGLVIPGDPVDAELMHLHVSAMVETISPDRWRMDQAAIKDALKAGADYIGERDQSVRQVKERFQFFLGSMAYWLLVESLGEPGAKASNFAMQVGQMDAGQWLKVYESAAADIDGWLDESKEAQITPATPAAVAILMTAASRAASSLARAHHEQVLSDHQAETLRKGASRAAAAWLSSLPTEGDDGALFWSLLTPFVGAIDFDQVAEPAEQFGGTKTYWRSSDLITGPLPLSAAPRPAAPDPINQCAEGLVSLANDLIAEVERAEHLDPTDPYQRYTTVREILCFALHISQAPLSQAFTDTQVEGILPMLVQSTGAHLLLATDPRWAPSEADNEWMGEWVQKVVDMNSFYNEWPVDTGPGPDMQNGRFWKGAERITGAGDLPTTNDVFLAVFLQLKGLLAGIQTVIKALDAGIHTQYGPGR